MVSLFKLWRLSKCLRQKDIENRTRVPRWKLSMLDYGHSVLTPNETKRLAKLSGIAPESLAEPCDQSDPAQPRSEKERK
jgi:hypothetical protein